MEGKKRRTRKIVAAEEMKATREERVMRKFEEVKNKWDRQRQLIKERTKKRETLADQGEKYRERNELNTLIEHLNKEEKKKVNWTENLRAESESIRFKEAVKRVTLEGGTCKGNRDLFERVFEGGTIQNGAHTERDRPVCGKTNQRENPTDGEEYHPYVTNRDAKRELYQGQIINKIKSNLEFVLKNFAVPLESGFLVRGRGVGSAGVGGAEVGGAGVGSAAVGGADVETANEGSAAVRGADVEAANVGTADEAHPPANEQPLRTSTHVIRINNRGRKVIPKSIELHNTSSSIVLFTISHKKKITLQKEVLRQRGYLFFDEHRNYSLVVSPDVGHLKPGEKRTISLTFFFHYFVNAFGALTIRYFCGERLFRRDVSVQVDSFLEGGAAHLCGGATHMTHLTHLWGGDASPGDRSLLVELAHTNDRHEEAPLKKRLSTFFLYTKGRVLSSADRFGDHVEGSHVEDNHVKGAHPMGGPKRNDRPVGSSPGRGASPRSGPSTDDVFKKNLRESFHEMVKQYVISLVQSYVGGSGTNEGQGIPLSAQNRVPTLAHSSEHYSRCASKRGKESSRTVKGVESPLSVNNHHVAFAKGIFSTHLLRSFPNVLRQSYFATLLQMALEQAMLIKSHSFYLRRYLDVIQFVRMVMLREEKAPDDLPPEEETVFIKTNDHLLRYIILFIHSLYRANQRNDQVNHLKEVVFYFLSSAFLCIRRGVRNVILFVGGRMGEVHEKSEDTSPGGETHRVEGEDFLSAVFHSFIFPFVRAFLSAQGKTHYAVQFVRGGEGVSRVCEAVRAQGGDSDDRDGSENATCNVGQADGETPSEEDFFKNFQVDEDYVNCFFGESGPEEPLHGGDEQGNVVFVLDREAFARAAYEWHYGWLVGRVERGLASAQAGQAGDPSAGVPSTDVVPTDVVTTDAPPDGEPTPLVKKKTATGKVKRQKRRNAKGESGTSAASGTTREGTTLPLSERPAAEKPMGQADDQTEEPAERNQLPCTRHHLEKLFEILGTSTYIVDDHAEADRQKRMHVPEGVHVQVGMVATKLVNILPFILNVISVEQLDELHREERHASYFWYDYLVLRNRDRLLEAMRKIVHYVDAQGDPPEKDHFFGKIPLPCGYEAGPSEEGEKHSTAMRGGGLLIEGDNRTTPKYLCIISPNVKNDVLDSSNAADMVEWLKLLNLAICMRVSDVYVCGQLFLLFLLFFCDSGSLPGRWCHAGGKRHGERHEERHGKRHGKRINQPYLRVDGANPTDPLQLNFINVGDFPEPLLLLLKVNVLNILQLCERYQVKIHFPHDMFLQSSELTLQGSPSPVYCRFPHRNYQQMIQASKRRFLRTYGHRLARLGSWTGEALRGEKPSGGGAKAGEEDEKDEVADEVEDDHDVVARPVDPPQTEQAASPPPTEHAASPPPRVHICSHSVGSRTLNSIARAVRGADKVLWLCGAFERDPEQGCHSSLHLIDCVVAAQRERQKLLNAGEETNKEVHHKGREEPDGAAPQCSHPDGRRVVHVNNLILLNEDLYALYHRHPRRDIHIPFLFRSHKVLVHLFDRTFPPTGFFSPFSL
ncbi:hypothetical protein PVIIG_03418 [Plasmodium vivax India VII]|uniref:Uncharacterized protein n=1 Tax=Plasmodium vivax India VII TaxID=1077284 RepID=A0A0J9SF39_PLAVI|nr:hypothetical protein PVIIG_03418 [Plasmodium vivax India VII]